MTQQYYIVCSIGPVQDFIATARTSRDLWFGSWMLSELSKAVAKALHDNYHKLIFPAPKDDNELQAGSALNVANKVVAIIQGKPKDFGDLVREKVRNRLNDLIRSAFDGVNGFDRVLAEKQLEDLVELYWAAVPYDESKGNEAYREARSQSEALFAARKNTRDFQQFAGKPGRPKSSLDGVRESVLFGDEEAADRFETLRAEKGESLSGIDLLKRWGERPKSEGEFVSTTDIAILPFKQGLDAKVYQSLLGELKNLRKNYDGAKETDGTHFYEDRMAQLIHDDSRIADFRIDFAQTFEQHGIKHRPLPYYALLQADGDNMGKTIDNQTEQSQHSALSQKLSEFANEVKSIIGGHEHEGVPIYAGGDDMLAYLPLHTALKCIEALNDAFKQAMSDFHYEEDQSPTLSAGLAIAHHLTPLSDVLAQARRAEKAAKRVEGKNGLVISLSKRGSAERAVKGKLVNLLERMEQLIDFTLQKAISHGAAYELENLQRRLDIPEIKFETRSNMLRKEAIRILGRKRESEGDEKVNKETRERFEGWFNDETLTLDELVGEMVIAAELAKAYKMAGTPPKGKTG